MRYTENSDSGATYCDMNPAGRGPMWRGHMWREEDPAGRGTMWREEDPAERKNLLGKHPVWNIKYVSFGLAFRSISLNYSYNFF